MVRNNSSSPRLWSCAATVSGLVAMGATTLPTAAVQAAADRGRSGGRPAAPEPVPLLQALGDSTVSGVGARRGSYVERLQARLAASGRTFRLLNLGQSGATTDDVLSHQVSRIAPGTGLVLLGVGVNDLTRNVSPEQFQRKLESIITRIRARTDAPIVVSNLPDISLARAVWPELRPQLASRVDAYNIAIARVSRTQRLTVFDACAMTRQELPAHPEYVSSDGFHPSDRGYEVWADGLWEVVQSLL